MPAPRLELLDPAKLLVGINIRDANLDDEFVSSVAELSVLQPVIAVVTAEGETRVRMGERRTLAAVKAGLATIMVVIVGDERTDDAGQIDRILAQLAENRHRKGLTAVEEARAVEQLALFGMAAEQIVAKTGLAEDVVRIAHAVTRSRAAIRAAEQVTSITLDQVAGIAEFEDDDDAVQELTETAQKNPAGFPYALQQMRDDREIAAARTQLAADLRASGITVAAAAPAYTQRLTELAGADGHPLTEKDHRQCPGHAAYLVQDHQQIGNPWVPVWFCAEPREYRHRKLSHTRPGVSLEDEARERQQVIDGNRLWATAGKVRRRWLTDFLSRPAPAAGTLRFVIESLARADKPLQNSICGSHKIARELLGLPPAASEFGPDRVTDVVDLVARSNDSRGQVIALAIVLGGYEASAGAHCWLTPAAHPEISRYFRALAGWDYPLSDIERTLADVKPPKA